MEMNHLSLEYVWNVKKEEMKKKLTLKERYKLYSDFTENKRNVKKRSLE